MVESELGVCQQDPDELAAGVIRSVRALVKEFTQSTNLFAISGRREHVAHREVDDLAISSGVLETPDERSALIG